MSSGASACACSRAMSGRKRIAIVVKAEPGELGPLDKMFKRVPLQPSEEMSATTEVLTSDEVSATNGSGATVIPDDPVATTARKQKTGSTTKKGAVKADTQPKTKSKAKVSPKAKVRPKATVKGKATASGKAKATAVATCGIDDTQGESTTPQPTELNREETCQPSTATPASAYQLEAPPIVEAKSEADPDAGASANVVARSLDAQINGLRTHPYKFNASGYERFKRSLDHSGARRQRAEKCPEALALQIKAAGATKVASWYRKFVEVGSDFGRLEMVATIEKGEFTGGGGRR